MANKYVVDIKPDELGVIVREPGANVPRAKLHVNEDGGDFDIALDIGPYKFNDIVVRMTVTAYPGSHGNPRKLATYAAACLGERLGRHVNVVSLISGCD
ncbi:MAG: hypothetical protein AABX14_01360 [Candidatus Aenigmatarchaeota archaeon]